MEMEYDRVPDFSDKTKWMELEVKRGPIYGNSGKLILPVGEIKYYREIKNKIIVSGMGLSITLFGQESCFISWGYTATNKKTGEEIRFGRMALRMRNGKWAISNLIINGVSIEPDASILHYHLYEKEVWIFLKAKNGWAIRRMTSSPG